MLDLPELFAPKNKVMGAMRITPVSFHPLKFFIRNSFRISLTSHSCPCLITHVYAKFSLKAFLVGRQERFLQQSQLECFFSALVEDVWGHVTKWALVSEDGTNPSMVRTSPGFSSTRCISLASKQSSTQNTLYQAHNLQLVTVDVKRFPEPRGGFRRSGWVDQRQTLAGSYLRLPSCGYRPRKAKPGGRLRQLVLEPGRGGKGRDRRGGIPPAGRWPEGGINQTLGRRTQAQC